MKPEIRKQLEDKLTQKINVLPDFAADFIFSLEYSKKEIRTMIEYAKDIALFFEFLIKEQLVPLEKIKDISPAHLDTITHREIRSYLSYLSIYEKTFLTATGKEKVQTFTNGEAGKSRKLTSLHELVAYLLVQGVIKTNITNGIKLKVSSRVSLKNRLTPDDMARFYAVIVEDLNIETERMEVYHHLLKRRDYVAVLLLSYTGIRVSELVQLDVEDISLVSNQMVVFRKGGKQERVSLPEIIVNDVADYIGWRKKQDFKTNALFVSLQKKRIDPKTVNLFLNKYKERAGIDIKVSPHVFRRTFGTAHYNLYRDMYLTAQILGHGSAETTRKFYADPSDARKTESMQSFSYGTAEPFKNGTELSISKEELAKIKKESGIDIEALINQNNK